MHKMHKEILKNKDNIIILNKPKATTSKTKFYCKKCRTFQEKTLRNLYRSGCKNSYKRRKQNEMLYKIHKKHPNLKYLKGYKKSTTKCHFICKDCGDKIYGNPKNILHTKYGCYKCSKVKRGKTGSIDLKVFLSRLKKDKIKVSYVYGYQNLQSVCVFKCERCQKLLYKKPKDIFRYKYACEICSVKKRGETSRATHKDFVRLVKKRHRDKYSILSKYKTYKKRIRVLHNECGCKVKMLPGNILKGNGCKNCHDNKSSMERGTMDFLEEKGIQYISEKSFDGCKDEKKLRFDFYLPEKNTIIELMGKQHYEPIEFFGGKKAYAKRIKHDKMKKQYCIDNNINYISIKYNSHLISELNKI